MKTIDAPRWRGMSLIHLPIVPDREPFFHDGAWWYASDNFRQEFGPFSDHVSAKLSCDDYHTTLAADRRSDERDRRNKGEGQ